MDFKDKVVIVTGASSGIGAASAVALAKRGAKVALIGRNEQRLKDNAARCCEEDGAQKVITIIADVTKPDDVRRIVATTLEAFGGIDVLINNAGTSISGDLQSTSMETFDEMIDVNLRSCVAVTKEAQIHLIRSKGVIVNLSSIAGTRPAPHLMAYSVAKAAVEQFTKCLAVEMAPLGVRVNAVSPGVIPTEIFYRPGGMCSGSETPDQFLERMSKSHPMQRVGRVEEVVDAILFLASDQSSFTSGAILPVDGARHATMRLPPAKE